MPESKLIVIGGGAAGFFCAINAARMHPRLKVTILEKSGKLLSKVLVSGGGRCNVTHACFDIEDMCVNYPRGSRFVRKAFHQFFTKDTVEWFESRGVQLKAEQDGRMFPVSDSSRSIADCLLREANKYGVEILLNREVLKITRQDEGFSIRCKNGETMNAAYICIASGGYPKMAMFEWLQQTGHTIEEPVPSLFTFNLPDNPLTRLMGVTVEEATIKIGGTKLEQNGPLLITHWGLSGPAALKLSAFAARELFSRQYKCTLLINWLPGYNEQSLREALILQRKNEPARMVMGKNSFGLPARLWEFLAETAGVKPAMRRADLPAAVLNRLIVQLCRYECAVSGKTTFKEEFVTAGGISLAEVDANTMMSKKVPGLYFAGEVLDVDGITGGFNFQHAWTSGWVAAKHIAFCDVV